MAKKHFKITESVVVKIPGVDGKNGINDIFASIPKMSPDQFEFLISRMMSLKEQITLQSLGELL